MRLGIVVMRRRPTAALMSHMPLIVTIALGCRGERPNPARMPADSLPIAADTVPSLADTLRPPHDSAFTIAAPELSAPMRQALDAYAPGFTLFSLDQYSPRMMQFFRPHDADPRDPLNQAGGDFNGDAVSDLALYGHDPTRELTIVLLSQPDRTYRVIPLREWPLSTNRYPANVFIAAAPPGPLEVPEGLEGIDSSPPPKTLPHGGIQIGYDGAGELFYWNGARFVPVTTGD